MPIFLVMANTRFTFSRMKTPFSVLLLILSLCCFAQDSILTIGIKEAPPFVTISNRGIPGGLSIEFWQLVQRDAGVSYKFKQFGGISEMLEAIANGEVDLSINPITVTDERMDRLDFSQPFFISGTAMVRKYESNWLAVLKNVFSWRFVSALLVLVFILLIFGTLVWFFERKQNPEQFRKGRKGLADGFWWSAVTMTTVGYGDKSPVSRGGRLVAIIWMFTAIILISGLTAGIASALTVQSLEAKIESAEDLVKYRVGTISGSSSADFLDIFNVNAKDFNTAEEGLAKVQSGELDVFVYDRPMLRDALNTGNYEDLILSPKNLKTDYYSFSFSKNNPLRNYLDPYVVKALKSEQWSFKLKRLDSQD